MSRVRATVGAVLWALVMTANAHAADGRISFSGSVVVPTCAPALISNPAGAMPRDQRSHCAQGSVTTPYTLRLEPAAAHATSQLVGYYADYVRASGRTEPVWVATQIYD